MKLILFKRVIICLLVTVCLLVNTTTAVLAVGNSAEPYIVHVETFDKVTDINVLYEMAVNNKLAELQNPTNGTRSASTADLSVKQLVEATTYSDGKVEHTYETTGILAIDKDNKKAQLFAYVPGQTTSNSTNLTSNNYFVTTTISFTVNMQSPTFRVNSVTSTVTKLNQSVNNFSYGLQFYNIVLNPSNILTNQQRFYMSGTQSYTSSTLSSNHSGYFYSGEFAGWGSEGIYGVTEVHLNNGVILSNLVPIDPN